MLDRLRIDEHRRALHTWFLAVADSDTVETKSSSAKQAEYAVQRAGSILDERDQCVPHAGASRVIISPMLSPGGTSGNTFASRSTLKSSTTEPSWSQAARIASSASSMRSTVKPRSPYASASAAKLGPERAVPLYRRPSKSCCHCLTIPR